VPSKIPPGFATGVVGHLERRHVGSHCLSLLTSGLVALSLQWFVVGHDCGHRSFSKNKLVEDIVGTIAFMPLIYPFEPWRIKHNVHHAYTNK